jgi:hypothetical protein
LLTYFPPVAPTLDSKTVYVFAVTFAFLAAAEGIL